MTLHVHSPLCHLICSTFSQLIVFCILEIEVKVFIYITPAWWVFWVQKVSTQSYCTWEMNKQWSYYILFYSIMSPKLIWLCQGLRNIVWLPRNATTVSSKIFSLMHEFSMTLYPETWKVLQYFTIKTGTNAPECKLEEYESLIMSCTDVWQNRLVSFLVSHASLTACFQSSAEPEMVFFHWYCIYSSQSHLQKIL